jgi:hypothetical protein
LLVFSEKIVGTEIGGDCRRRIVTVFPSLEKGNSLYTTTEHSADVAQYDQCGTGRGSYLERFLQSLSPQRLGLRFIHGFVLSLLVEVDDQ